MPSKSCLQCGNLLPVDSTAGICPTCEDLTGQKALKQNSEAAIEATIELGLWEEVSKDGDPDLTETISPADAEQETDVAGGRSGVLREEIRDGVKSSSKPSSVRRFADYEIESEIARGGMGVVFKARQLSLNRPVALKMILSAQLASATEVQRFYVEAESAAKLEHPGIVPIYEVGQHKGQHFFSMGLVEGGQLSDLIQNGPLPPREAAALLRTVAEAVQYAHARNIVHRDLKPANILLDSDGQPKVTDFGLAKNVEHDSGLTVTGQVMGTPAYMPPEQASGKMDEVGPLADVYSLGAIAFFLLTSRPPFQSNSVVETLQLVTHQEPVSPQLLNPQVDIDLATICLKCLEKEPLKRYSSMGQLADELGRYLRGEPITARPVSRPERARRWCKRNPFLATLILAVTLSLLGGIGLSTHFAVQANTRLEQSLKNESRATAESLRADLEAKAAKASEEEAKQDRDAANRIRDFSRQELDWASRRIYINDMQAAHQAWLDGKIVLSQTLLDLHRPRLDRNDQRGWEWYYLNGLNKQHLAQLTSHQSYVDLLDWSPDGRQLAAASSDSPDKDSAIVIWDPARELLLSRLTGYQGSVTAIDWAYDSSRLASSHDNGQVIIWDVRNGDRLHTLSNSTGSINTVAWNSNDSLVAATGNEGTIDLWDATTGMLHSSLRADNEDIRRLEWSPAGEWLASCAVVGPVRLWDVDEGNSIRTIKPTASWADASWTPAFAWHPEGKAIACEYTMGSVMVFGLQQFARTPIICTGHRVGASSLEFSSDGRLLAAFGPDEVKVWDRNSGGDPIFNKPGVGGAWLEGSKIAFYRSEHPKPLQVYDVTSNVRLANFAVAGLDRARREGRPEWVDFGSIYALQSAPDGNRFASAGNDYNVTIWPSHGVADRQLPPTNDSKGVGWYPDEKKKAVYDADTKSVNILDVQTGDITTTLKQVQTPAKFTLISPNSQLVALLSPTSVDVYDVDSGDIVRSLHARDSGQILSNSGGAFAWSPDSNQLVASTIKKGLTIWDIKTGNVVQEKMSPLLLHMTAWSPDGTRIAGFKFGGPLVIWDLGTDNLLTPLAGEMLGHWSLAWSPDSSRLLTFSYGPANHANLDHQDWRWYPRDHAVLVWDPATVSPTLSLPTRPLPPMSGLQWSSDGKMIRWPAANPIYLKDATPGFHDPETPTATKARYSKPLKQREPMFLAESFVRRWHFAEYSQPLNNASEFVDMDANALEVIRDSAFSTPVVASESAFISVEPLLSEDKSSIAVYAARRFHSNSEQHLRLFAGAHFGSLRIWLNGRLVIDALRVPGDLPDQESADVVIRSGENIMVVEVSARANRSKTGFYLRIEDLAGRIAVINDQDALAVREFHFERN